MDDNLLSNLTAPKNAKVASTDQITAETQFYRFELMTSSGPRKESESYANPVFRELGEDAAGIQILPGQSMFWLADGTSEEPRYQAFSARILAQDAGASFCQAALRLYQDGQKALDLMSVVNTALADLQFLWQKRVLDVWENFSEIGQVDEYLRTFTLCGDGILRISWSTTFMAGIISHQNGLLSCLNLGDSGCVVQSGQQDTIVTAMSGDRLGIRLSAIPKESTPPRVQIIPDLLSPGLIQQFKDVEWLLCVTDGNTRIPLKTLFDNHASKGVESLAGTIKRLRDKSYDDRTLVLGQRMQV